MQTEILETLYEIASEKPGWLSKLAANCSLAPEDLAHLEWLDDSRAETARIIAAWDNQVERDGGWDIVGCEDDAVALSQINTRIFETENLYEESAKRGEPYFNRAILVESAGYEKLCRLRTKIRARTIHTEHPDYTQVTEHDIALAREYPLEILVELDRSKRMICPFHKDKRPSMWVKNGFGYCFSCGAWCDSIRYLMEVKGSKFAEAVLALRER